MTINTKKGAFGFGALVQKTRNIFTTKKHQSTRAHPTKDDPDRVWTNYYHRWFNDWFLNELAWQPTLFKKIKKCLELEYKIWFERRTSRPKCATPLHSFYIWLRYQSIHAVSYRWFLFSRSFEWHVKCYLMFWKLPKLLEHSLDALEALESMKAEEEKEHYDYRALVYSMMEDDVADRTWCHYLTKLNKKEADLTDAERAEIYQDIKESYEIRQLKCPDKYLTQDEQWDRAEIAHEDNRMCMSGGPDYDDRPAVVGTAKRFIKKNKIISKYHGDWGQQ